MTDLDTQILTFLARRDWRLTHPDLDAVAWSAFAVAVQAILVESGNRGRPADEHLDRAVIGAYCPVLHAACAEDGSDRQRRAFEELWRWVYPRVYQRVDSAEDAEDVSQEVMRKVYQNLHQVTDPRGFLAWVNKITFRTISSYYRHKDRRGQFEELSIDAVEDTRAMDELIGTENVFDIEMSLAEEDLVRMIDECMPPRQRRRVEVLVALVFREMTVTEVATHMHTSRNNVYGLYFHARQELLEHCKELVEMLVQRLTPTQREMLRADQ